MGFASGFRAGYDVVRDVEERRRKEELRRGLEQESAKYAPTEVAAGDEALRTFRENYVQQPGGPTAAEYEAQYLGGLQQRPAGYTVEQALVPELGGRQYETLAAAEQAVAPQRSVGLANVYRQAGEIGKAEEMMGLSRQAQLQNLQIGAAQRAEDEAVKLQTATQQIADLQATTGTLPSLADIRKIAADNKLSLDQQFKLGQNITGIAEQDAKALASDISKKIKGKGLDALLKLHKDDPTFDDNSFFEKSVDKKGKVTLTQKANDGTVLETQSFPNSAAAVAYLNKVAVEPASVYTWLQTSRLNEANIAKAEAQTGLARSQAAALPTTAAGLSIDRRIKLAEQYRDQLNDLRDDLLNTDANSPKAQRLAKQIDDLTVKLYGVTESIRSGLQGTGKQTSVGETINVRGQVFRKTKEGPDSDSSSWEPVSGGAAPAGKPTSGAKPSAPSQAKAAPVGLERMGQGYGRFTPEAVLAEGVRAGDPNAIAEQRRRQEVEAARSVVTPGYNELGVY